MFKRFFDYYGFSKIEQRGFFVLVVLIFGVVLFQLLYDYFDRSAAVVHEVVYFNEATADDENVARGEERATPVYSHQSERRKQIDYFTFDPNGLPAEKWEELGFSAKQAAAIKNYEAKGGKFKRKEDVAKLYVVSEADYARLAPYIVIAVEAESKEPVVTAWKSNTSERVREVLLVDINTADTSELKRLRGIGSVLASRTVKYREALGGFHAITQMGEVYGISPELFESLQPHLGLANPTVQKININSLSEADLSKHPYISRKQAQLISNYRRQHGAYTGFSDLRKIHALDEDFLRKIEPYLEW